jgi:hypothetical protein
MGEHAGWFCGRDWCVPRTNTQVTAAVHPRRSADRAGDRALPVARVTMHVRGGTVATLADRHPYGAESRSKGNQAASASCRAASPNPWNLPPRPRLSFISPRMNLHLQLLVHMLAGWVNRHQQSVIDYLHAENRALREQLGPKRIRWTDAQRRRPRRAQADRLHCDPRHAAALVPEARRRQVRWLGKAWARASPRQAVDPLACRRGGSKLPELGNHANSGALLNLGHDIARNTVKNTLLAHGLQPAPERGKRTSWRTFLQSHLGAIAGADVFTVEVLSPFGLVRTFVLFVIDIGTRRVQSAGISSQPGEATPSSTATLFARDASARSSRTQASRQCGRRHEVRISMLLPNVS